MNKIQYIKEKMFGCLYGQAIGIIAKTKRATFKNETSKSSLFSLPFFSGSFGCLTSIKR